MRIRTQRLRTTGATGILRFTLSLVAILATAPLLPAQLVNDGETNTISGITTNVGGAFTVGTNGSQTALLLTNSTQLSVTSNAFVGREAGSFSNSVAVGGPGTFWLLSSNLFVGSNGWGNWLDIRGGGTVSNVSSYVGFGTNSSNNFVLLADVGTLWANESNQFIGFRGSRNWLFISNGAVGTTRTATVGDATNSDGNGVIVDGVGSRWEASGSVTIGNRGRSNSLLIRQGGVVLSPVFYAGLNALGGDNSVVITDPGSMLSNSGTLQIGVAGYGNRLIVSNGARIFSDIGVIGNSVGNILGIGNYAVVTGSGTIWTNRLLHVGPNGTSNSLTISSGGCVMTGQDAYISTPFDGQFGGNNSVTVSDSNSTWVIGDDLEIGNYGGADRLTVNDNGSTSVMGTLSVVNSSFVEAFNGGSVTVRQNISLNSGSLLNVSNGYVVVTNALTNGTISANASSISLSGSGFVESDLLTVSSSGSGMFRFFGGTLVSRGGSFAGQAFFTVGESGTTPAVWQLQPGPSIMTVNGNLVVGSNTAASQVRVLGGQRLVITTNLIVGFNTNSAGNFLLVSGQASQVDPVGMVLGHRGASNRVLVEGGATVVPSSLHIGSNVSSGGNQFLITGSGSALSLPSSGDVFVGESGSRNQLLISNGASVRAQLLTLGNQASSTNNELVVTGAGSSLRTFTGGSIDVGGQGRNNRMIVSEGGAVTSLVVAIGRSNLSSGNLLWVRDAGSTLTNSGGIYIGYGSSNNTMIVSDGATVQGSSSSFYVGYQGSRNLLIVSNGGTVLVTSASLGFDSGSTNNRIVNSGGNFLVQNATGTGAFNVRRGTNQFDSGLIDVDQLVLTNPVAAFEFNGGTLVTKRGTIANGLPFIVGATGLTASEWRLLPGANFVSRSDVIIGPVTGANSNTVQVAGGMLVVTNATRTGTFDLRRGTNQLLGGGMNLDVLLVTNSNPAERSVFEFAAGTLTARSGVISNGVPLIIGNGTDSASFDFAGIAATDLLAVRSNASARLIGSNLVTTGMSFELAGPIDFRGSLPAFPLGSLTLQAGAAGFGFGEFGLNQAFAFTALTNNGSGLVVSNWEGLPVTGGGNDQLRFSDTNGVTPAFLSNVTFSGYFPGALLLPSGEIVAVGGVGLPALVTDGATNALAALTNGPWAYGVVGTNGDSTCLVLTNGTLLSNVVSGFIGKNVGADSNCVIVAGAGTRWLLGNNLVVGSNGAFNSLVVSGGAGVTNGGAGILGAGVTGNGNMALVTGAGSVWSNRGAFVTGGDGADNKLMVSLGGVLQSSAGYLGLNPTSSNNVAVVTDAGSRWSSGTNYLGYSGSASRLVVSNGGVVRNSEGYLGFSSTSGNSQAVVTGEGSVWDNTGPFYLGYSGSGNQLVVNNGGTISDTNGYLGFIFTSLGNVAVVTGAGSVWSNGSTIYVGYSGSSNQLLVSDGALISTRSGFLGFNASGSNNGAVVTGSGTLWSNSVNLHVGNDGPGNHLVISNGGVVSSYDSYLGVNSTSSDNTVVVTGAGSAWNNLYDLILGENGSGNRLVVSDGGVVQSTLGRIGYGLTGSNNVVMVTGAGSVWNSADQLWIGGDGPGNRLVVSNGGAVGTTYGLLGYNAASSSDNVAMVTGTGSLWSVGSELRIGNFSSGNLLVVSNGGMVQSYNGSLGVFDTSSKNVVVVTDTGSLWSNANEVRVGWYGSANLLVVSNGGTVFVSNAVYVGLESTSGNNRIITDGGTLRVANAGGTAALDIRRGTSEFNSGLIDVDQLVMTNTAGFFEFNAGTLNLGSATVSNGLPLTVGNGPSNATYRMSGTVASVHSFANSLVISTNATLTGNGTIIGTVTNSGTISPGSSPGKINVNSSLFLTNGSLVNFELGGTNAGVDYDQVAVTNFVQFAGTLSLALINNFLPGPADTFTLVSFNSSSGIFNNAINGLRVSFATNLASFHVSYDNNLVLSDVQYADNDGDGQGDMQEIAAGTDPASQASEMRIEGFTRNATGHSLVQFQSVAGKNYRIEYSNDLITWSVATVSVPAIATSTQWVDDGTLTGGLPGTKRFYRVGLQ